MRVHHDDDVRLRARLVACQKKKKETLFTRNENSKHTQGTIPASRRAGFQTFWRAFCEKNVKGYEIEQ